jgi:hypothetical protein
MEEVGKSVCLADGHLRILSLLYHILRHIAIEGRSFRTFFVENIENIQPNGGHNAVSPLKKTTMYAIIELWSASPVGMTRILA